MTKKYTKPMTLEALANVKDEDINFDDIPELDEKFWKNAKIMQPEDWKKRNKKQVTLRVDADIIDFFKNSGKDWQTRINAVLRDHVKAK